jgi:hypothetical protein
VAIPIGGRNTPVPHRDVLKGLHTTAQGKKVGEGD